MAGGTKVTGQITACPNLMVDLLVDAGTPIPPVKGKLGREVRVP